MIKLKRTIIFFVFIFSSILVLVSCGDSNSNSNIVKYEKLCDIYKEIVLKPTDLSTKEMQITERVQLELPDFYKDNFVHIAVADADQRYQFIKKLAGETKSDWSCETIKNYYDTEFVIP